MEDYQTQVSEWLEWVALDETDSTNNQVLQLQSDKEVVMVSAEYQTRGRGQRGNTWESQPGQNLMFSLLIHPQYVTANEQFILSQALSLAIQQTLSDWLSSQDIRIKWPNDIYWKDKKICGILIENALRGKTIESSVLGVGLNVNQPVFFSDAPNPVSMHQITGEVYQRTPVLLQIVGRFHQYLQQIKAGERANLSRAYFQQLYRADGIFPYRDAEGVFMARIVEVEPMGHLVLTDTQQRVRRYAFKEIEYLID